MKKHTLNKKNKLEQEIAVVHDQLTLLDVGSEEYSLALEQLGCLYEIRDNSKRRVSPDTLAMVGCNLLGIMLVMKQEEFNVITSKAFGFIMRGRA